MIKILSGRLKKKCLICASFLIFFISNSFLGVQTVNAALEYGQTYPDIGTFSNMWGNWSFWIGWDANFSETYNPEGKTYEWLVYFAPEAIYLALHNSKSVYSGVNVNAGYKSFYGVMDLATNTRLSGDMILNDFDSVGFSRNLFNASTSVIGTGAFSIGKLSFSLSSGRTFKKEKNGDTLKRAIQVDSGISVSYDLISNPLPFSVSLGVDCDAFDPEELCYFHGFYPLVIWDIEQQTSKNPIDVVIAKLQANPSSPSPATEVTKKALLHAVQIMQANTSLKEFLESLGHNSSYDTSINEIQQWLQTGDTSNLPENIDLPDPVKAKEKMMSIYSTTQMSFELGYLLGCQANPSCTSVWDDCIVTKHCIPNQECVINITSEELVGYAPGATVADFEGSWLLIDNPVEHYLISEAATEEWLQIINGKASYTFSQNTDTPVFLGLRIDPAWSPVSEWIHPCSRVVYFDVNKLEGKFSWTMFLPAITGTRK